MNEHTLEINLGLPFDGIKIQEYSVLLYHSLQTQSIEIGRHLDFTQNFRILRDRYFFSLLLEKILLHVGELFSFTLFFIIIYS